MKLQNLLETPLRGGDLRQAADTFASSGVALSFKDIEPIADIEEFKVKKLQKGNAFNYALFVGDDMVLIALVKPLNKMMYPLLKIDEKAAEVDDVWVAKEFEGKRLYSKFLWFLKSREGYHQLLMGKVQSDVTIAFLKAGGLSKFEKTWRNTATGEVRAFNPAAMDEFYGTSNWRVVLESTSTEFDDYNRFNEGNWIQESYDWQIS